MSNYRSKLINEAKLKVQYIEFKLELRKFKKAVRNSRFISNLKKFYLLFLICACILPLFTLKPSAQIESKLIKIANQLQISDNTPIVFAEPANYKPELNENFKSVDYIKYKLLKSENLDLIVSRFSSINKDTIVINNPNKEFTENQEIILPTTNGYLIGFGKDFNVTETAKALDKNESEIKELMRDQAEGYILIKNNNPVEVKKNYDINLIKLRTPIPDSKPIVISPNTTINSTSFPSSDLSSSFATFVNNTRGISQHDGNGWSPGQCVSLVKRWQQFIGAKSGYWPGNYPAPAYYAYLAGNRTMAPDSPSFKVVVVTDPNSLQAGDLLITTGYPSHTGIATGRIGGGTFDMYDQNSPVGSAPRFNTYPTRMFIGAIRYIKN
jgi:hypothetical protein